MPPILYDIQIGICFWFCGFEPQNKLGENSCFPPDPFSALNAFMALYAELRGFAPHPTSLFEKRLDLKTKPHFVRKCQ